MEPKNPIPKGNNIFDTCKGHPVIEDLLLTLVFPHVGSINVQIIIIFITKDEDLEYLE